MSFNLIKISSKIDTTYALEELARMSGLWKKFTGRQDYPGSAHKDTESIYLRWAQEQSIEAAFTEITAIDYPEALDLKKTYALVNLMYKVCEGYELGRAMVVNLKPGGVITPHVDEGAYADYYERFHLSLCSDEGNSFCVMGKDGVLESVHMKSGELWWFNHKCEHTVFNHSNQPRLHLIVDMVSPKYRRDRH